MHEVTIVSGNVNRQRFSSFEQAFRFVYDFVNELRAKNELPQILLDQGIWIEEGGRLPLFFWEAVERARSEGLINDEGRWQPGGSRV